MPAIANITAQNAAAANVTFNAMQPSSGDGPAIWRAEGIGTKAGFRPVLEVSARPNAKKDGRRVFEHLKVPVYESVSGVDTLVATIPFHLECTIPTNVSDTAVADAVAFWATINASTLVKDMLKSGYAAS